jgi:hypothetical protein
MDQFIFYFFYPLSNILDTSSDDSQSDISKFSNQNSPSSIISDTPCVSGLEKRNSNNNIYNLSIDISNVSDNNDNECSDNSHSHGSLSVSTNSESEQNFNSCLTDRDFNVNINENNNNSLFNNNNNLILKNLDSSKYSKIKNHLLNNNKPLIICGVWSIDHDNDIKIKGWLYPCVLCCSLTSRFVIVRNKTITLGFIINYIKHIIYSCKDCIPSTECVYEAKI